MGIPEEIDVTTIATDEAKILESIKATFALPFQSSLTTLIEQRR